MSFRSYLCVNINGKSLAVIGLAETVTGGWGLARKFVIRQKSGDDYERRLNEYGATYG